MGSGQFCRRYQWFADARNGRRYRHGGPSTGPRTQEGLQRIMKARTVQLFCVSVALASALCHVYREGQRFAF
jgi:hypothetical protein